jgi:hypothetical protein
MSIKVRRAAGAVLILAACGATASGFLIGGGAARDAGLTPAARLAADAARRKVETAWRARRNDLEARAMSAAATQPLQSAINSHVDGHTIVDLFETEDWWRPVREEFKVVRLFNGGLLTAAQGKIDIGNADVDLVASALRDRVASAVLNVQNHAVVAAAAQVDAAEGKSPVLLVGNPLDATWIQALADATGQAVMLAGTSDPVAIAGPPEQRVQIQSVSGREAETAVVDAQGQWLAAVVPLGPGVHLWTLTAATADVTRGRKAGVVPWLGAPVLLAAGLLLLVSRRREGAIPSQVVKDTTLRFGTAQLLPGRSVPASSLNVAAVPGTSRRIDSVSVAGNTGRTPNRVFGRYKLLDHLGQGGMADVYTAVASGVEGFTRTFVLKRLRPELSHDKDAVSQFIDEARMQAGLVHSNIVPVFDFGVVGDEYFMTQEYIVGRDMVRVIQRYFDHTQRALEPRYAYYVAHETLLALEYAHTKRDKEGNPMGIVHRDVSAANIMLSLEGEVKLFDFGIVKARGRSTQTQVGMVKGNTSFMSPEQARGQQVDARSDVFSLALVMYYCMTGRLLYEGDNDLDVLYKAATGPSERDWEAIYQLPRPAPELLARALAIDPAQRYQTAAEFAQDLAPHINGVKAESAGLMQLLFGEELRREAA